MNVVVTTKLKSDGTLVRVRARGAYGRCHYFRLVPSMYDYVLVSNPRNSSVGSGHSSARQSPCSTPDPKRKPEQR
ncbi:unnamed protein product, partial [Mesorhabditis belari]|uniref:Uncharacterized protein n=1 Tax=Mesorhabditis belari TaxID=2138241 RepID=A0AAF3EKF8_9BILA